MRAEAWPRRYPSGVTSEMMIYRRPFCNWLVIIGFALVVAAAGLASALSPGVSGAGGAAAAPFAAPATWRDYAALVKNVLQQTLSGETGEVRKLRMAMRAATPGGSVPMFIVRIWIRPNGKIARAEMAAPDPKTNLKLNTLLVDLDLGAVPPDAMPQPLAMRLSIEDKAP